MAVDPHATTVSIKGISPEIIHAVSAMTYVTHPDVWPKYVEWIQNNYPDAIPHNFDSEGIRETVMLDAQRMYFREAVFIAY